MKFRWETEFKETEIGEIPKDWEVKKLDNIVKESIVGCTPLRSHKEYWNNGIIPWLTNKELEYGKINYIIDTEEKVSKEAIEKTNLKIVPPNSLIVSFTASVGKVAINKIPITTNQQFISFILKDASNVVYYGYYFVLSKEIVESYSGATPFSFVTKEKALTIPVPFPPLPEQNRIATILSWFDDLIENKRRQNEILENMAMAIFKSWFIDFEPFQDEEFVYSEELDMEIPEGWEVKPIGEIAEFINGLSYSGKEKFEMPVDESLIFITLNNILREGGFKLEYSWIRSERLKEHHFLSEGDLIMANTDMTQDAKVIGSPAIVVFPPEYKGMGVYSHHITKIKPRGEKLKLFLYLFLKITQNENITFSTGTNVLGLDIENFKKNKHILIPPQPILQRFHSLVEPLFQKIILNQKQIMTLKKIRDTLLPQLVFGRLRVEEI